MAVVVFKSVRSSDEETPDSIWYGALGVFAFDVSITRGLQSTKRNFVTDCNEASLSFARIPSRQNSMCFLEDSYSVADGRFFACCPLDTNHCANGMAFHHPVR